MKTIKRRSLKEIYEEMNKTNKGFSIHNKVVLTNKGELVLVKFYIKPGVEVLVMVENEHSVKYMDLYDYFELISELIGDF